MSSDETLFVINVEADGPCPGLFSITSFGAVLVEDPLQSGFYAQLRPISEQYERAALFEQRLTRARQLTHSDPAQIMPRFIDWVRTNTRGRAIFVSDDPGFDWQFINYYCHAFGSGNPFAKNARSIADFYAGIRNDWQSAPQWQMLRPSFSSKDAMDEARQSAHALIALADLERDEAFRTALL
jgi:hypothetical protein